MSETLIQKTLKDVKVGDYVWIEGLMGYGTRRRTLRHLRKIMHIDHKGRLYTSAQSCWSNWRYGFKPDTGMAQEYSGSRMRIASEEEITVELAAVAEHNRILEENKMASHKQYLIECAAEDLYEASKYALQFISEYDPDLKLHPSLRGKLEAAVAKAEGRQSGTCSPSSVAETSGA